MLNGVLNHCIDIIVGTDHQIGHVAVHKHLAGLQSHQVFGGNAAIGTADVQEVRVLTSGQFLKILRVGLRLCRDSLAVIVKYFGEQIHYQSAFYGLETLIIK